MYFIAGTVLLVLAVGLMRIAHLGSVQGKGPPAFRKFATTEVMTLVITTLYAFGFGALAGGLAAKPTAAGFAELGLAVVIVVVITAGIVRLTRPRAPVAPAGVQKAPV